MKTTSGRSIMAAVLLVSALNVQQAFSQQFTGLEKLPGHNGAVYYSHGEKERAMRVGKMVEDALAYGEKLVTFRPHVTVLVLSLTDWKEHTNFPVYGMPHFKDDRTLVVASTDNEFWQSFIPPLDKLPRTLAERIQATYRNEEGKLSMQPFFDLLALHELGHAFHIQGGLKTQRKWMGELFCNLLLHTYIAERQPSLLNALTVFPQMVIGSGTTGFNYTSLSDFESNYVEIATKHPKNYGWYQCNLHDRARDIYEKAGVSAFQRLWTALRQNQNDLTNEVFADMLKKNVHPSVADVYLQWNK